MKRLFKNKVLAFVIALMMIASTFPMGIFSVSATTVQGEAIETADDFAAMEPNGTYYLANSITLTETYSQQFTGKFNGNGETITVSAPIFGAIMNATVENFTVTSDSAVTLTADGGIVCGTAGGNTTLRNITNNVSLQSANTVKVAGIVGDFVSDTTATITIDGCVNTGSITGAMRAGGIACGATDMAATCDVNIKNCKNTGAISSSKSGGIICLGYYFTGKLILENCENSGAVTSGDIAGGIVSHVGQVVTGVTITGCRNSGAVTSTKSKKQAGGIIGLCQISDLSISDCFNSGDIQNTYTTTNATCGGIAGTVVGVVMERCGNTGNVTSTANAGGVLGSLSSSSIIRYCYNTGAADATSVRAAGIVADANNIDTIITGCYNSGTITGIKTSETGEIFGKTVITDKATQVTNNYITGEADYATTFTDDDLASGKLAYDINTAIGKTVYHQNVGIRDVDNDTHPVLDSTHAIVFPANNTYYSLRFHTLETASVRISDNAEEKGIRFSTAINKTDFDNLPDEVKEALDFGTIITPNDYLKTAGDSFTALGVDDYVDVNSTTKVDTGAKDNGYDVFMTPMGETNIDYYYFCGSITNITYCDWDYSAIGYIKIGDATVYSGQYATRNIEYVANAAYNDRSDTQIGIYKYEIAANSDYAIDGKATYSPYTENELALIATYSYG